MKLNVFCSGSATAAIISSSPSRHNTKRLQRVFLADQRRPERVNQGREVAEVGGEGFEGVGQGLELGRVNLAGPSCLSGPSGKRLRETKGRETGLDKNQ
jgi:hypothetical protein